MIPPHGRYVKKTGIILFKTCKNALHYSSVGANGAPFHRRRECDQEDDGLLRLLRTAHFQKPRADERVRHAAAKDGLAAIVAIRTTMLLPFCNFFAEIVITS